MKKRLIALISMIVVLAAMGSVNAASASAASCQIRVAGPGWKSGYQAAPGVWVGGTIYARAGFYNCVGVEAVRFIYSSAPNWTGVGAGFFDVTVQAWAGPGMNKEIIDNGTPATWTSTTQANKCSGGVGTCDRFINVGCWWWGHARTVWGFFTGQYKSMANHQWSGLVSATGPPNTINITTTQGC